jgi:alpha-1,3/alpha-1,6-mannosyltransferase
MLLSQSGHSRGCKPANYCLLTSLPSSDLSLEVSQYFGHVLMLGGYDDSVPDNVHTLTQLKNLCAALALTYHVIESPKSPRPPPHTQVLFLLNFTTAQRSYLLTSPDTLALLYTPSNEHFGIVPLESMACGLPVLAVNSGGPTETVIDLSKSNGTGLLRPPDEILWSEAMKQLITMGDSERKQVSIAARKRINDHFSAETLGKEMEAACREAIGLGKGKLVRDEIGDQFIWVGMVLMGLAVAGFSAVWVLVGI